MRVTMYVDKMSELKNQDEESFRNYYKDNCILKGGNKVSEFKLNDRKTKSFNKAVMESLWANHDTNIPECISNYKEWGGDKFDAETYEMETIPGYIELWSYSKYWT